MSKRRYPKAPLTTQQQAEYAKHLAKQIDSWPGGIVQHICQDRETWTEYTDLQIQEISAYRKIVRESFDATLELIRRGDVFTFYVNDQNQITRGVPPRQQQSPYATATLVDSLMAGYNPDFWKMVTNRVSM